MVREAPGETAVQAVLQRLRLPTAPAVPRVREVMDELLTALARFSAAPIPATAPCSLRR